MAHKNIPRAHSAATSDNLMPTTKQAKEAQWGVGTDLPSTSSMPTFPLFSSLGDQYDTELSKCEKGLLSRLWDLESGPLCGQCATGLCPAHVQNRPPDEASQQTERRAGVQGRVGSGSMEREVLYRPLNATCLKHMTRAQRKNNSPDADDVFTKDNGELQEVLTESSEKSRSRQRKLSPAAHPLTFCLTQQGCLSSTASSITLS